MLVRFTSVTWDDVSEVVTIALKAIEHRVAALIEKKGYGGGVDAFLGVLISVDDADNHRFAKAHNRLATVTDAEGRRFKQLSMALELSPELLEGQTATELYRLVAGQFKQRLNKRPFRLAKGFDWISFSADLQLALGAAEPDAA